MLTESKSYSSEQVALVSESNDLKNNFPLLGILKPGYMYSGEEELGPLLFPKRNPQRQSEAVSREVKRTREAISDTEYTIINLAMGRGPAVYMFLRQEDVEKEKLNYAARIRTNQLVDVMPKDTKMPKKELMSKLTPDKESEAASQDLLRRINAANMLLEDEGEVILDLKVSRRGGSIYMRTSLEKVAELSSILEQNRKSVPSRIYELLPNGIPTPVERITFRIYAESTPQRSMNVSNRLKETKAIARQDNEVIINLTKGANRTAVYLKFDENTDIDKTEGISDKQKRKIKIIQEELKNERIRKVKIANEETRRKKLQEKEAKQKKRKKRVFLEPNSSYDLSVNIDNFNPERQTELSLSPTEKAVFAKHILHPHAQAYIERQTSLALSPSQIARAEYVLNTNADVTYGKNIGEIAFDIADQLENIKNNWSKFLEEHQHDPHLPRIVLPFVRHKKPGDLFLDVFRAIGE